jgi:oligoendopeptidase F
MAVTLDCVLEQTALHGVVFDHEDLPCSLELIVTGHCRLTSCETIKRTLTGRLEHPVLRNNCILTIATGRFRAEASLFMHRKPRNAGPWHADSAARLSGAQRSL